METISCQEKFTVDFFEKFDKRGIIIDNPSMVESAREIDRLKTIVHFHLRFPRNGTTERADAWERQYENWWVKHFGYYAAMAGNGWLYKSGEAIEKLAIVDLGRNTELLVEAAVNSPISEISQAAVAKRKLSIENFAIALAHPRKSVFTLLDAEKIAPRTKWEYLHWQRKMGMSKEEAREALELATRIVKGRQVLEVDKNGVPVLGARQQKWL